MSDTYYYFECVGGCDRDVVLDIRVKDGGKVFIAYDCPVCSKPMDFRGRSAADADGYSLRVDPDTLREAIKLVWSRLGKMHNPWTNAAMSSQDPQVTERVGCWYQNQIELGREMFKVVCLGHQPTDQLLRRGLAFLNGQP